MLTKTNYCYDSDAVMRCQRDRETMDALRQRIHAQVDHMFNALSYDGDRVVNHVTYNEYDTVVPVGFIHSRKPELGSLVVGEHLHLSVGPDATYIRAQLNDLDRQAKE